MDGAIAPEQCRPGNFITKITTVCSAQWRAAV